MSGALLWGADKPAKWIGEAKRFMVPDPTNCVVQESDNLTQRHLPVSVQFQSWTVPVQQRMRSNSFITYLEWENPRVRPSTK